MKYITFTVPSYNSQDYLNRCVDSLLVGSDDVEIIIVNDGSTDSTAKIADEYASAYPNIVKVIHKANGGHGSGVNAGIKNASGVYFKVVDSDDWVDEACLRTLLCNIKRIVDNDINIDLFVTNYVYNRLEEGLIHTMHYRNIFKHGELCTWDDMGKFGLSQYFMMHALTFKTDIIKKAKVNLPEHTFYVDNIFAYQPLPYVEDIIYLDIDFYQYYIGREDQSVNEKSMLKNLNQQFRVTREIMNCHNIGKVEFTNPKLAKYMARKLSILMTITSILCAISKEQRFKEERNKLWEELKQLDENLYSQVRYLSLNIYSILPEALGDAVAVSCFRFAKKIYMFA